jgi:aminopeptidase N
MDPLAVSVARRAVRAALGSACRNALQAIYVAQSTPGDYSPAPLPAGRRALKNLALSYLVAGAEPLETGAITLGTNQRAHAIAQALRQFDQATNMTDRMAAFSTLVHEAPNAEALEVLERFYDTWQHDALVIDKWFGVQAT